MNNREVMVAEFPLPQSWLARNAELASANGEPVLIFRPFSMNDGPSVGKAKSVRELLDEFTKLKADRPRRVLAFAQRWGSLHLCRHGLPPRHAESSAIQRHHALRERRHVIESTLAAMTYPPADAPAANLLDALKTEYRAITAALSSFKPTAPCRLRSGAGGQLETVGAWADLAAHFRRLRSCAAYIKEDDPGGAAKWWPGGRLGVPCPLSRDARNLSASEYRQVLNEMRAAVGALIDRWLRWAPMQIRCSWEPDDPGVVFLRPFDIKSAPVPSMTVDEATTPMLLPLLVLQMTTEVFDTRAFMRRCAHCYVKLDEDVRRGRPRQICDADECQRKAALARKIRSDRKLGRRPT